MRALAIAVVVAVASSANARVADEREEQAIAQLVSASCPGRAALVRRAGADFHDASKRGDAEREYQELASCAPRLAIVHTRLGDLAFARDAFPVAEAHYRQALALEPTTAGELSLLQALVREKKPEADVLYAKLSRVDFGRRDDEWAELAYLAFHREDDATMRRASDRAIGLDTKWWQPWFTRAVVELVARRPDRARAQKWLDRADALGAPTAVTADFRAAVGTPR